MWLIVFALGLECPIAPTLAFATEFLRTFAAPAADVPLTLSRLPALGFDDVFVFVMCSFC